ncbi:HAD-IIB family hydrolase [uncultured Amphritea sp.]|uniref:HAD-IIB family hydrolase n=1 Tax=uncultured Amphritea sp. TaxID=981605 RepID=UPI00261634CE|nr:HAD-IIB family hydrolase [uncultured Amphritea sp.]
MTQKVLIFTDLDGSLLDHFSYSFSQAESLLSLLNEVEVPVIPVTSKTRAELTALRVELESHHPFVVENGAAVFIPENYFPTPPSDSDRVDDYFCCQFSKPRDHWIELLGEQLSAFGGEFETFTSMGVAGIQASTGLSASAAQLANQREFSEPVKWLGTDERKQLFVETLRQQGATVLQGGRFLHVTGACNKGKALQWLKQQYADSAPDSSFLAIAAGDSYNDIDMLQVADCALVIRSPVHEPPPLEHSNLYLSSQTGPAGWVEGVSWFLGAAGRPADMNSIEYLRKKLRSQCYG